MNTARELLDYFKASGYTLRAKEGGKLGVRPAPPEDLKAILLAHKSELLALLASNEHRHRPCPRPARDWRKVTDRADRQRAYLGRAPLVSDDDLLVIRRAILPHLVACPLCAVDVHDYCPGIERTARGYTAFLTEFPEAEAMHAAFAAVVIRGRVSGLPTAFRLLDDLHHWREQERAVKPAEAAFAVHVADCRECLPGSGRFCAEGRELREMASREATH